MLAPEWRMLKESWTNRRGVCLAKRRLTTYYGSIEVNRTDCIGGVYTAARCGKRTVAAAFGAHMPGEEFKHRSLVCVLQGCCRFCGEMDQFWRPGCFVTRGLVDVCWLVVRQFAVRPAISEGYAVGWGSHSLQYVQHFYFACAWNNNRKQSISTPT